MIDLWKDQTSEKLVLECLQNGARKSLPLFSDRAYYLCAGPDGVFLREEFSDTLKPGLIGVLFYSHESGGKGNYRPGNLAPLGERFRIDRENGCFVVNSQAFFGLGEPVHIVDRQSNKDLEVRIYKARLF